MAGIFIFSVYLHPKCKVMAETSEKKKHRRFSIKKLNNSYTFTMSVNDTMEPVFEFKVNLLVLSIITLVIIALLIFITTFLIAFTPIRKHIPGYADEASRMELYILNRRADSIERELYRKDVYFNNLKLIVEGYDIDIDSMNAADIYTPIASFDIDTIEIRKSVQDSALRAEFERDKLSQAEAARLIAIKHHSGAANFFAPINGNVIKHHDPSNRHYGVDIAATDDQVIKATMDGTVVYSAWTLDFGYTIGIQHESNYYSSYKHNSTLLKKEGDYVKAGEAIAIVGESGEMVAVPHLHFELWHNGISLNPEEYIYFEESFDD